MYRERQEKVAHVEVIAKIVARVFNVDADKAFGHIVSDYASQVFQEMYDLDLLRTKVNALREAQRRIQKQRSEAHRMLNRLERMGEYYDRELGPDLLPVKKPVNPTPPLRVKPSSR